MRLLAEGNITAHALSNIVAAEQHEWSQQVEHSDKAPRVSQQEESTSHFFACLLSTLKLCANVNRCGAEGMAHIKRHEHFHTVPHENEMQQRFRSMRLISASFAKIHPSLQALSIKVPCC